METVISSKTKTVIIGPDQPFTMIGERINPTGRKLLAAEMTADNPKGEPGRPGASMADAVKAMGKDPKGMSILELMAEIKGKTMKGKDISKMMPITEREDIYKVFTKEEFEEMMQAKQEMNYN